jgi:hypothetical protein
LSTGVLAALGLLAQGATCAVLAGYVAVTMIGEVNRKLSDDKQISYLWWHYWKQQRLFSEYTRLYPRGSLKSVWSALIGLAVVFLVAGFLVMVFTSPAFH